MLLPSDDGIEEILFPSNPPFGWMSNRFKVACESTRCTTAGVSCACCGRPELTAGSNGPRKFGSSEKGLSLSTVVGIVFLNSSSRASCLSPRIDVLKTQAADARPHRAHVWLPSIFTHRNFSELQRSQARRFFLDAMSCLR